MAKDVGLGRPQDTERRRGIYVGIVKKNDDPQNMGRCSIWIPEFGGDPDNEGNWFVVGYASPFAGSSPVRENRKGGGDQASTQTSYGFWMQPPDLDNQVLVAFANGDVAQGYWFACIFQQNMNHAVPGMASNVSTDDSLTGEGIYPPVVEYNKRSKENPDSAHRPTFEPLHNGLSNQGLYPDAERGRSSSSARREAPSKVFGYSTPRGSGLLIDDNPDNEFIRLRTRGGAQVLVHETSGYVYINSKNGNSWIEISDEGVDIYSKKSISIRAEEDLNFRAERDVNIEGERGVFIRGGKAITTESGEFTHMKAGSDIKMAATGLLNLKSGGDFNVESGGAYTGKAAGVLTMDAGGQMNLKAGGNLVRTASQIHDNGPGAASAPAVAVPEVRKTGDRVNVKPPISASQAQESAGQLSGASAQVAAAAPALAEKSDAAAAAIADLKVEAPLPATAVGDVVSHPTAVVPVAQLPSMYQSKIDADTAFKGTVSTEQANITAIRSQMDAGTYTGTMSRSEVDQRLTILGNIQTTLDDSITATRNSAAASAGDFEKLNRISTQLTGAPMGGATASSLSHSFSGATSAITSKVDALSNVASGISGKVTQMSSQLTSVAGKAQGAANQLTQAANSVLSKLGGKAGALNSAVGQASAALGSAQDALNAAVGDTMSAVGQVQGQIAKAQGAINSEIGKAQGQINGAIGSATSKLNSAISSQITGQIGGKLGSKLSGAATAAVGSQASKLAGVVNSTIGQVQGKINNEISSAVGKANNIIGQANGLVGQGLGAISQAQNMIGSVMGEAQQIGNQISQIAKTAEGAAQKIESFANSTSLPLTADTKAALKGVVAPLTAASTSVAAAAAATTTAAGAGRTAAVEKTTVKTIVQRMPTHEPWPVHVKEGQPTRPAPASKEEAVAAAAARPGQGAASGAPEPDPAFEVIKTGTGETINKLKKTVDSVVKIGSAVIQNNVLAAVKEAASITGVDVGYVMSKASEMGFDPATKLAGAVGLMQVTQGVFNEVASRYGAQFGIGPNDIRDARANALVGSLIAKENTVYLEDHGLATGPTELSMAHLMGAPVAAQFLTNLARDPAAKAAENVAETFVRQNRTFFYGRDGAAKSLDQVYQTFNKRYDGRARFFREEVEKVDFTLDVPPIPPELLG